MDKSESYSVFKKVINDLANTVQDSRAKNFEYKKETVSDIQPIYEWYSKRSMEYGYSFNPFNNILPGLNEIGHSKIIAFFLNPHANHYQKSLFIDSFLKLINVKNKSKFWTVATEYNNVDIRIDGYSPRSIILIENKSNRAEDQSHQLYRYWYENIFPYNNSFDDPNFQIIYLSQNKSMHPSENSISRLDGLDAKNLPEKIEYTHVSLTEFAEAVLGKATLDQIPASNHRLKAFIEFYKEIWKTN